METVQQRTKSTTRCRYFRATIRFQLYVLGPKFHTDKRLEFHLQGDSWFTTKICLENSNISCM